MGFHQGLHFVSMPPRPTYSTYRFSDGYAIGFVGEHGYQFYCAPQTGKMVVLRKKKDAVALCERLYNAAWERGQAIER